MLIEQNKSMRYANEGTGKMKYLTYVVFTLLSILSTVTPICAVANFIFCLYIALTSPKRIVVPFFVYATFFATLCKVLSITEMSLFTIVMLVYILKLIYEKRTFEGGFFVKLLILICLLLGIQFINGYFDITRNIKFFENYLYLYLVIDDMDFTLQDKQTEDMINSIFRAFLLGVIFSSLTRLLNGSVFQITKFASESISNLNIGTSDYVRFSGLYGDPNYYAINVILAMCVLEILLYLRRIKVLPFVCLEVLLAVFAIMTRSKSALLMLIVPLIFLLYINRKEKRIGFQIVTIMAIVAIVWLALGGYIDWFSSITDRFIYNSTLDELTTGRASLWRAYMQYLETNPFKLLFGVGISTPILSVGGAHNTYIDVLYFLGIIPGLVYFSLIINIARLRMIQFKRNLLNYSVIIVILVMYFFLSCLFDIDLCTNLMLMIIVFNLPLPLLQNGEQ